MTNQPIHQARFPTFEPSKLAFHSSRPRSSSRPLPIVIHPCRSSLDSEPNFIDFPSSTNEILHNSPLPLPPVEPITSPAFLKGDLNFTTFRQRAARAIAEWGPSPTRSQFITNNVQSLSPKPNSSNSETSTSSFSHGLEVPNSTHHLSAARSPLVSPPVTPLTPAPYSKPNHREKNSAIRRSSLKISQRPRPSPLQLKDSNTSDISPIDHSCEVDYIRSVRFADGSPLRGSTWHITQYPARLASPPISAANLSLADLIELQAIKQSLGTWCGEMIGSPMRGSFSQSSMSSISDLEALKSCTHTYRSFLSPQSYSTSPASCSPEDGQSPWNDPKCPEYSSYDSDCDSEIFEGMH